MSHADATRFAPKISKAEAYSQLLESLAHLVTDTTFWPTNLANTASLLWHLYHSLPAPSSSVNWSGFYVKAPSDNTGSAVPLFQGAPEDSLKPAQPSRDRDRKGDVLLLGPFMGKVACQKIEFGRGVCGNAALEKRTQLVADVDEYPNHIACDGDSRSEIVVPIVLAENGECVGVIDIDCTEVNGFDEEDQKGLEAIAKLLANSCDWTGRRY